jgi:catechol 2,3-dioxygenase-like lactoylglutathione lyase family enzyme
VGVAPEVVDLVPFILVADVERSIPFYEALGFEVVKRYEPADRLEFAVLEATSSAKLMLARVDEVPDSGPDAPTRGFLDLYTHDLEELRARLLEAAHAADEIEDGPAPGPDRQMCVRDRTATGTWSPSCSRARSEATLAAARDLLHGPAVAVGVAEEEEADVVERVRLRRRALTHDLDVAGLDASLGELVARGVEVGDD